MNAVIHPCSLHGRVSLPPSKSWAQRLLLGAACAEGDTLLLHPGDSTDVQTACVALKALGVSIEAQQDGLSVHGTAGMFRANAGFLSCGESGTLLRLLLPLLSLQKMPFRVTGEGRLPNRPLSPLIAALRENGAVITEDTLPLTVNGGLHSGIFRISGAVSSQFFSGLLLALPMLSGDSAVHALSDVVSLPYVRMTERMLALFGIRIEAGDRAWHVPGHQRYVSPGTVSVPDDASAAAFFYAADYLGHAVSLPEAMDTSQPDSAMPTLLKHIGAVIDCTNCPDLVPILALTAAAVPGKTTQLRGIAHLRHKESDRVQAILNAIHALGGSARQDGETLVIEGGTLRGGTVDGCNDHRIVMSAAIAATVCSEKTIITGAEAVRKSYPCFFRDFIQAGGHAEFYD